MKIITTLLLSIFTLTTMAQDEFSYSKSVNQFAFDMFEITSKDKKNIVFSPFSISSALSMTYCGAKVKTKKDMRKVLYLPKDIELMTSVYAEYNRSMQSEFITDNITLKIANSLWGEKSYPFNKEYIKLIDTKFNAPFNKVSFINNSEKSRKEINKWVEKKTENKIKELIPPKILSANTRLVLTNAIYFYGGWAKAFKKAATKKADFHVSETEKVAVDFLNTAKKLFYYENDLFKAVEIPYKGKAASLMIFMPKNIEGFNNLSKTLDFKTYSEWNSEMKEAMVQLSVPKFTIESDFELSEVLSKMGMKVAFTNTANFTGMSNKDDLKIDKVIHKAKIGIDEEGTEAAAATAVVMVRKTSISGKLKLVEFKADRPFIFILKENKNNTILFMGKVVKP